MSKFKDDNIIPLSMLRISYLSCKNTSFTGSYKNKRYKFVKENENEKDILVLYIWNDKFCFEKTDKKCMQILKYEFTKKGIEEGLDYLSNLYENI